MAGKCRHWIRFALGFGTAVATQAVCAQISLNPHGTGQALYVPWYTVEDGQSTLLSLQNTEDEAKAVWVKFTEALNGIEVMAFTVYLPPRARWSAAVVADGEGARIVASDGTCTLPSLPGEGVPFYNSYLRSPSTGDLGPSGLERTRTGAVEFIERAVFDDPAIAEAIAARECAQLTSAWAVGGAWRDQPQSEGIPPTGGLSANAVVVQVTDGVSYTLPAIAIEGFSDRSLHAGDAGGMSPNFGIHSPACFQDCTVRLPSGPVLEGIPAADAVSALFMTRSLSEEIHLEESLEASTDWIVAFPTRRAYLPTGQHGAMLPPFTGWLEQGEACQEVDWSAVDDEGKTAFPISPSIVFIGSGRCNLTLCRQVQRIPALITEDERYQDSEPLPSCAETNQELEILPIHEFPSGRRAGSGKLFLGRVGGVNDWRYDPEAATGLPALGYRISRFVNANAQPGILGNYVSSSPLKAEPVW